MNKKQYDEFLKLSKEYIIEEGKLLPSPLGGYMLGVYGTPGFNSSHEQFNKVGEIRGRLMEAFRLLQPSEEESRRIKEALEKDKDVAETLIRKNDYLKRVYKKLPEVMETCNKVIENSFSEEQIQSAETIKKSIETKE